MASFRLALSILGTEVFALQLGERQEGTTWAPGTVASQVERSEPAPLGFHVQPNPSVED